MIKSEEILKEINEVATLQEQAIYTHPQEIIDIYEKFKGLEFNSGMTPIL